MLGLAKTVNANDLEVSLLDVVRLRTSQIKGCAHCADMQSKDLRARGKSEQRLYFRHCCCVIKFKGD
jgi:AhpD family alkylhydroperoxidase